MTPSQPRLPMQIPPLLPDEREYQRQVLDLMKVLGWRCVHHRPLRTRHGWQTGVEGHGSAGWPDIVGVKDGRLLVAELKSAKGRLTDDQAAWLRLLAAAGVECFVWRVGVDSLQSIATILQVGVGGAVSR